MRLEINNVSGFAAFSWVKEGWQVFKLNPAVFMGATAVLLLIAVVPSVLPAANLFISFLLPFLMAGFYQIATDIKQEKPAAVGDLLKYLFDLKNHMVFFKLALAGFVLALLLTPFTSELVSWMSAEGERPSNLSLLALFVLGIINIMLMAFAVPIAWVAPKTPVMVILQQSFQACSQNIGAMIGYVVLTFFIIIVSAPIILLGWIIAYALINLSFLQAFLSLFQPERNVTDLPQQLAEQEVIQGESEKSDSPEDERAEESTDNDNSPESKG